MRPVSLYDFQKDFKNDIAKSFRSNNRVVAQASTGFGKTIVMADIAAASILKGNTVCIVVHREEILHQTYKALKSFGIQASLIVAGNSPMSGSQCYIAMVETIKRRMTKGLVEHLGISFMILDELHRGEFYNLITQLECKILGFTATPKTTGKPELKEYFDCIVCGIPLQELIRIGRLVPTITYSINHDFSKIKRKGGDFDDKALAMEFKKPVLRDGALDNYIKHAKGEQALAYCVNVEESNTLASKLRDHGIKSAHLDGNTSKSDRHSIWEMYKSKRLDVICNVGIATTGTDLPQTRCIIKNYATISCVKDVQVGGRGGRCDEGKDHFKTIDMGCNYLRFGEFGEFIDWEFIFQNPNSAVKTDSKREKRNCDDCGAVMKIAQPNCPYCGAFTDPQEIERHLLVGASIEQIREYKIRTTPPHLRKPISLMSNEELKAYGVHMGYSPRWYHTYRNKRGNY